MFIETKTCAGCGEEFQIHSKVQRQKKFCGGKCADAKWAKIRKESRVKKTVRKTRKKMPRNYSPDKNTGTKYGLVLDSSFDNKSYAGGGFSSSFGFKKK